MLTSIEKQLKSCDPTIYKFLMGVRNRIERVYRCEADKRSWVITKFDVSFDAEIACTGL